MIDLVKLYEYKPFLGRIAQLLTYPDKQTFQFQPSEFKGIQNPMINGLISTTWEKMQLLSMDEIEELYVQTFDFQKSTTLYMTHAKFEDSRERGQMLATLQSIYEMFGLEISDHELADYLPLMCEFLYAAEWLEHPHAEESFRTLFAVLEDGTYELMKALEKIQSPYYELAKALREIFKQCLRREVVSNGHD